jgi:hypothetical protein
LVVVEVEIKGMVNKLQLALSGLVTLLYQIVFELLKLPLVSLHQNFLRPLKLDSHYLLFLREPFDHFVADVEDNLAGMTLLDVHKDETLLIYHYRSI